MIADQEVVKKVIDAIDEDSRRNPHSVYTFDYFCKKFNLYHDTDKTRNGEISINCVFHTDSDPSLNINESKRQWHCLGCNCGGNYVQFRYQYESEVLGDEISFYHYVNRILKEDPKLQAVVGASTVFKQTIVTKDDLESIKKFRFKKSGVCPSSYLELSSIMIQQGCSNKEIELAILGMQAGLSPEILYKQVFSGGRSKEEFEEQTQKYSLEEMGVFT